MSSPTFKTAYLRYLMKRAAHLGPKLSFISLGERLFKKLPRSIRPKSVRAKMSVGQEMMETAASRYQPKKYEGKVLLLLAAKRPSYVNLLPGWQEVIPHNLHAQYVDGYHRDLLKHRT